MNLVGGDLLPIIAMWKKEDTTVKPMHRLTVACSMSLAGKPSPVSGMLTILQLKYLHH
jgi:hypothetical protein